MSSQGNASVNKFKRPKYCWGFNKGVPCKFGKNCEYIERCSYCDSPAHRVCACPKLFKKESGKKRKSSGGNRHESASGGGQSTSTD